MLQTLEDMQKRRVEANSFIYNIAIGACDMGEQWQTALELLKQLQELRWDDVVTYNAVLAACGHWLLPLGILEQMQQRRVPPDLAPREGKWLGKRFKRPVSRGESA